jgi:ureidoacrylate peracid hydrolase
MSGAVPAPAQAMDAGLPTLPDDLVQRAIYRRGRANVYDGLDPKRTALLVIDMQHAWLAEGAPFETPATRRIVPAINRLAGALRDAGGLVVWFQHTAAPVGDPLYWSGYFDHHVSDRYREETVAALLPGTPTHAIHASLDVRPGDLTLRKYRFSPFLRNPDDPLALLEARGIESVIVVGTATNVGVESTVRDAMMLDFRTFMPHDAVVAPFYDGHLAAMRSVVQVFADVRPVDELIAAIDA